MSRSRWDAIAVRGAIKSLFGVKKNSNSASDTRAHKRHEGTYTHQCTSKTKPINNKYM